MPLHKNRTDRTEQRTGNEEQRNKGNRVTRGIRGTGEWREKGNRGKRGIGETR